MQIQKCSVIIVIEQQKQTVQKMKQNTHYKINLGIGII